MSGKMPKTQHIIYLFMIFILVGVIVYGSGIKQENDLIKSTFTIDESMDEIYKDYGIKGEEYYLLASEDYILENYRGVVINCEKARDYYSQEGQRYRNLKAELELEKQNKIIILYQDLLSEQVVIAENMYEACEYFESASKYFEIYYNTDVPYDDASFEMGNFEIESMNKRINLHDDAVRRNNDILSKITAQLSRL